MVRARGTLLGTTASAYSAIALGWGSSNNQITHNLIQNCQGAGINFGAGPNRSPNSNNIIDRNILQNVDTNVVDMGAIYLYDQIALGRRESNYKQRHYRQWRQRLI